MLDAQKEEKAHTYKTGGKEAGETEEIKKEMESVKIPHKESVVPTLTNVGVILTKTCRYVFFYTHSQNSVTGSVKIVKFAL